jgi:hypothetical protein
MTCPLTGVSRRRVPGDSVGCYVRWLGEVGLADDGEEWLAGAIALADLGCGDMAVLGVTGPGRGRVAYIRASQAPSYPPDPDCLA